MSAALSALPEYLVLDPTSTIRIDLRLEAPACEIDVSLDNPRSGRSVVLMLGRPRGPFAQRVRLAGRARIHFEPEAPGSYSILLANPQSEPIVIRLRVKPLGGRARRRRTTPRRVPSSARTRRSPRRADSSARRRSGDGSGRDP